MNAFSESPHHVGHESSGGTRAAARWKRLLVAAAAMGFAVLLRIPLNPLLDGYYPYLTFFPAVLVSALYSRWKIAGVTAVLSGLVAERFFAIPRNQFTIDAQHLIALAAFLFVCSAIIWAIEAMHRFSARAQRATRDAEGSRLMLAELNAQLEERVRSRTAEVESMHRALRSVMDGSPDPMAAVNLERQLTAFNVAYADEFERRFGDRPRLGDKLDDLLAPFPSESAKLLALWQRAVQGLMVSEETLGDPARGQRTYQINSSFIVTRKSDGTRLQRARYHRAPGASATTSRDEQRAGTAGDGTRSVRLQRRARPACAAPRDHEPHGVA